MIYSSNLHTGSHFPMHLLIKSGGWVERFSPEPHILEAGKGKFPMLLSLLESGVRPKHRHVPLGCKDCLGVCHHHLPLWEETKFHKSTGRSRTTQVVPALLFLNQGPESKGKSLPPQSPRLASFPNNHFLQWLILGASISFQKSLNPVPKVSTITKRPAFPKLKVIGSYTCMLTLNEKLKWRGMPKYLTASAFSRNFPGAKTFPVNPEKIGTC